MNKYTHFSARITEEMKEYIKSEAKAAKETRSEVVRDILQRGMRQREAMKRRYGR